MFKYVRKMQNCQSIYKGYIYMYVCVCKFIYAKHVFICKSLRFK